MTNEETIFAEARGKSSATARSAYLDQACAGNLELRREVEALLLAHERAIGILESPPVALDVTIESRSTSETVGSTVGPYKLLEQIGGGGMGVVYMAEQVHPVRRRVALKIIKPGMDSGQVIARFEAERQALTMMDHPNIAKVLDAGTTLVGRPYFVMELVKGIPITDYCDQARLTTRERLDLFMQVCHAVQHAHQKGVIHRDLKPTNVLVTLHDDKPVPKVIDFGIAKAAGQNLTDKTLFTNYAQMLGTPLYMSPEQAQISGLDVDTRSDVYSLGVLLYELLTGTTPFDKQRLREAAYDEMRRIIREEDPPNPSTRLSTMGDQIATVSALRHTEPKKLSQQVHGELDWIAMKALEKDRSRRYETPNGLAADVDRFLNDEPVQACPPSARYRFRKFARRNKLALAVSALVLFFLVLLAGGIGWAVRDRTARQARVSGQLDVILADVARLEQAQKWSEALVSARRAEPALAAGEATPNIQERAREVLADLELVQRLDEIRARAGTSWGDPEKRQQLSVQADHEYAAAFRKVGIDADALSANEAARRITARKEISAAFLPAIDDWVAVRSIGKDEAATRRLIDLLHIADPDAWRQQVRDALIRKDWPALANLAKSPDMERQPAATLTFLSAALRANGQYALEIVVLRRTQSNYPADYWINHRLGVNLVWLQTKDDIRDGIGFLRAAVAIRPRSAHSWMNLGNGYDHLRQYEQSIACFRTALEIQSNPPEIHSNFGGALAHAGRYDDAIASLERSLSLNGGAGAYAELSMILSNRTDKQFRNARRAVEYAQKGIEFEPQNSSHWTALGIARYRENRWEEALTALEKSMQLASANVFRWADAINWYFLAMTHWQLGQKDQARTCYDRATQEMENADTWQTDLEQLLRFRAEAEELLKIPRSNPATNPQSK